MPGPWHNASAIDERERAKTLALVVCCILIGVLYALGGIALYLRSHFLVNTPIPAEHRAITRAPQAAPADVGTIVVESPTPVPAEPVAPIAPTEAPTLYPTMTASAQEGDTPGETSSQSAGQPIQPTTAPPTAAETTEAQPATGQSDDSSAAPTATLYPTATPRNDPTEPPPAPPTREGR